MSCKTFFTSLTALFLFVSCNSQSGAFKNVSASEFETGIAKNDAQLVDVRTPEEYKEKHIARSVNLNFNADDFETQLNKLDKTKPVYLYCLAGSRSKKASEMASAAGFKEVYNLKDGINSWINENKPVVNSKGVQLRPNSIGMSFDDYLSHLKAANKLVLVDFNAVWCGPCKTLKPIVTKTVKKNAAVVELFDIDVDKHPTVANTMNVRSIPLLVMYKQGKEVWRNLGLVDESLIQKQIDTYK